MTLLEFTTVFSNIASIGTLCVAFYYARKFDEKAKKRETDILKEKEWQVVWADNFLKKAIDFNNVLSSALTNFVMGYKSGENNDADKLIETSRLNIYKLRELEWDIKNYTLFISNIEKSNQLNNIQSELITFLINLHAFTGKVNLEDFRIKQFEYSKLIREIHSELLEIKPEQINFKFSDINLN